MATHKASSPECKRLMRIAGLIEANLKNNLDEETSKLLLVWRLFFVCSCERHVILGLADPSLTASLSVAV
jgi:hypothetical protein